MAPRGRGFRSMFLFYLFSFFICLRNSKTKTNLGVCHAQNLIFFTYVQTGNFHLIVNQCHYYFFSNYRPRILFGNAKQYVCNEKCRTDQDRSRPSRQSEAHVLRYKSYAAIGAISCSFTKERKGNSILKN